MSVAQESARGTLVLFAGNLLSVAITTITVILMARLLGPDGYGVYTLAFVIPALVNQFMGFGVNVAVTRYVAFHVSTGEIERAKSITRTTAIFLFASGTLLSGVNFLLAPYLVGPLIHRPELASVVQLASLWILGVAITTSAQATFVGWSSMAQASGFNVLLSILKLVLTIGLILIGFGVTGAILGHIGAYLGDGLLGIAALFFVRMRPWKHGPEHFLEDVRRMLRYGFPVFAGGIVSGLAGQYALIVLASVASNSVVGFYQAANNVTVAITVLSGALSLALFRSFATLHGLKENISLAFAYSVKYGSYVLTPLVFFLLATARPLVDLLYGPSYSSSVLLLQIATLSFLPVAIGMLVLGPLFNGIGAVRFTLLVSIVAALGQAVGSYVLGITLGLGATGVMLALVVANLGMTVSGLILSRNYLGAHLPLGSVIAIFLAGLAAFGAVWFLPTDSLGSAAVIAIDAAVYLLAYLTLVPAFRGLDEDDFTRLSIAGQTMGPVRRVFELLLAYERRILRLRTPTP